MTMNDHRRTDAFALLGAAALLTLGAVGPAHAGCATLAPQTLSQRSAGLMPAIYHPSDAADSLKPVGDSKQNSSIVGLWKFEWLSDGKSSAGPPAGTLLDFGFQAWHPDGTEIINSGNQNPADGDFCLGVWKQVGSSEYQVKHIPLAYSGGNYVGPVLILESITLGSSGNTFTGHIRITPFLATKTPGHEFDRTNPLVPEAITGTITGTRVQIDN